MLPVIEAAGAAAQDLAASVMRALGGVSGLELNLVTVRERTRVVHLTGHVANHRAKREAEQAAAQTSGVLHVVNELRVASPTLRSDNDLSVEMGATLRADPLLQGLLPGIEVRDGMVFLHGAAGSFRERCAAEERAWSVRGVLEVHNRLTFPQEQASVEQRLPQDIGGQAAGSLRVDGWHGAAYPQGAIGTTGYPRQAEVAVRWKPRAVAMVKQLDIGGAPAGMPQLAAGVPTAPDLEQHGAAQLAPQGLPYRDLI